MTFSHSIQAPHHSVLELSNSPLGHDDPPSLHNITEFIDILYLQGLF